jgi:hypothetical protein
VIFYYATASFRACTSIRPALHFFLKTLVYRHFLARSDECSPGAIMTEQSGKTCFDRDQPCATHLSARHLESMTESWHPAIRLLFIVGSAASLWALLLALIG